MKTMGKKIVSIRQADPFAKNAKARWDSIPKYAQTQILGNVFCGKCRSAVTIVLQSAETQKNDLILRGKCRTCGHEVCRLVEPDGH